MIIRPVLLGNLLGVLSSTSDEISVLVASLFIQCISGLLIRNRTPQRPNGSAYPALSFFGHVVALPHE